jgi:hypothetical protein
MSERTLREDPIAYRIEYARIARLLQKKSPPPRKGSTGDEGGEKAGPSGHLELSAAATRAIDSALRGLTPEQESAGMDFQDLSADAADLVWKASGELERLRWRWVGRRPPWYVRWLGWRHWRRRREYLALADFLDRVLEPATVVLYFSCQVEEGRFEAELLEMLQARAFAIQRTLRRPLAERWRPKADLELSNLWLLAYLSQLLGPAPAEPRPRPWPIAWLAWMGRRGRLVLAWLGVTRWRQPAEPNYRVRYNLACLFSRLAAQFEGKGQLSDFCLREAEHQLRLSLEALHGVRRAALADWARTDPGLAEFRGAQGHRFDQIVPTVHPAG